MLKTEKCGDLVCGRQGSGTIAEGNWPYGDHGVEATGVDVLTDAIFKIWRDRSGKCAADHGFHENWNDGSKLCLIHAEVSELLESLRKDPVPDEHCPELKNSEAEAADILIRLLDFCSHHNIDLGRAMRIKYAFNLTRPVKHGKKF